MQWDAERVNDTAGEPSLTDMVDKAIDILSKNPNGYFLFVEGGFCAPSRADSGSNKSGWLQFEIFQEDNQIASERGCS